MDGSATWTCEMSVADVPAPDGSTHVVSVSELEGLAVERNGSPGLVRRHAGDMHSLGCIALVLLPEKATVGVRSATTTRFPRGCDGIEDVRVALPESYEAVVLSGGGRVWRWSREELGACREMRLDAAFNGFEYARMPQSLTVVGSAESTAAFTFTQIFHQPDRRRAAAGVRPSGRA